MRQPRHLEPGARYHVTSRGHQKRAIFATVADKQLFLEVLARAKQKFDFRLENLCLMSNHFHALVFPGPTTNLSRLMQWILSVFAQAWNRRHGLTDRVWGPRFFSRVLEGLRDYLRTFLYIDRNPVKARLVNDPDDWPFGRTALTRRLRTRRLLDAVPEGFDGSADR